MLSLPLGILGILLVIRSIRREPRRFANAVVLLASIFALFHGVNIWLAAFFPHLKHLGDGSFELTTAGTLSSYLLMLGVLLALAAGIALIINGMVLIRRESRCLAHMLPILFGGLCILLVIISGWKTFIMPDGSETSFMSRLTSQLVVFLAGVVGYVPFALLAYLLYSLCYRLMTRSRRPDYIIVLGASLVGDRVSPLLAKRLDKAAETYHKNGDAPLLIVSGGQGEDEVVSEACAMRQYLLEQGIPDQHIRMEDQSVNTHQNMEFSRRIVEQEFPGVQPYGIFTTNNFHVLRSAIIARTVGLHADGVGCKTAGYYYPAASIREAIAFVFGYKKLVAAYVLLLLLYRLLKVFLPTVAQIFW